MAISTKLTRTRLWAAIHLACLYAGMSPASYGANAEIYQQLRLTQNAYQLAPNQADNQRQYILALRDARLADAALKIAKQYPTAVSDDEMRGLQADEAAELTRLAAIPSRTREERFLLADRALARYEQLLGEWSEQGLGNTAIYQRARLDRLQALHARQSMQTLVDEYELLRSEGVVLPSYLINEVASAYLYLKQPEKAAQLYQTALTTERLDAQEVNNDRLGLYYALQESGDHEAASRQLAQWMDEQSAWRAVTGSPQPLPNEPYLNTARTAAIDPIYNSNVGIAIEKLQTLADAAPRDAGLRIALGDAQRLQGLNRQAEKTLKQAETLEPVNAELISVQGLNALALQEWEQARILTEYALTHYPESQASKRLQDEWARHQKAELQITTSASNATDSPVSGGRDFVTEAVIYSPPIGNGWRVFGGAGYANADFTEGELNHRWLRAGAQWRTRDLTLEGDLSTQNYGHGTKTGVRLAGQVAFNDHWQAGAEIGWRTPNAPLRALKNNISAKRLEAWVRRTGADDSEWLLAIAPTRFSDGNQRFEARLHGRERLYASSEFAAHLELDISASRNSRTDTPYFSPRHDLEVLPGLVLTHTLYRRYDTVLQHSLQFRAGTYSQRGYGTGSVMALGYGVRYQTGKNTDIQASVLGVRRPYDGRQERELRFQLDLNFRF